MYSKVWAAAGILLVGLGLATAVAANEAPRRVRVDMDAQPVAAALLQLSRQEHFSFAVTSTDRIGRLRTRAVHGSYTLSEAIQLLLGGTGLTFKFVRSDLLIVFVPDEQKTASAPLPGAEATLPEVLVVGLHQAPEPPRRGEGIRSSLVFAADDIEHSLSESAADLIKQALPGSLLGTANPGGVGSGGGSEIDLRGLGPRETLVLIDGRRTAGLTLGGMPAQADLRAIPADAVERIEVLQASASAIYGGDAAGGAINIVLRRDCNGSRLRLDYDNGRSRGPSSASAFASHCISLGEGRAGLALSGGLAEEAPLEMRDRNLLQRGRQRIVESNPGYFAQQSVPPLGAQTNIRSADGGPLFGPGTPAFGTIPAGYTVLDGIGPLLKNAGTYDLDLAPSAQLQGGGRQALRAGLSTRYLDTQFTNVLSARARLGIDATISRTTQNTPISVADDAGLTGIFVPASAPDNLLKRDLFASVPAPGSDGVLTSTLDSRLLSLALTLSPRDSWNLLSRVTMSESEFGFRQPSAQSVMAAVNTGALNVLNDPLHTPLDISPWRFEIRGSRLTSALTMGTLRLEKEARDSPVSLIAQLEHRAEQFSGGTELMVDRGLATPVTTLPEQSRSVTSLYGEMRVPLLPLGTSHAEPALEVSLAARADQYRVSSAPATEGADASVSGPHVHSSFTGTSSSVALLYRPVPSLRFRASYSTGFFPPSGSQLALPDVLSFPAGVFRDSHRSSEPTGPISVIVGGNPHLSPEQSQTWFAGLSWTPAALPGFRFTLDYTRIQKINDVAELSDLLFSDEGRFLDLYPSRVLRTDGRGPGTFGRILEIDATAINVPSVRVSAWDAALKVDELDTHIGCAQFTVLASWQPTLGIQPAAGAPALNEVDVTTRAPMRLTAVSSFTLTRGSWTAGWNTRYWNGYRVSRDLQTVRNQGFRRVSSQFYQDVFASYQAGDAWKLQISLRNVLNRQPAFDAGAVDTGYASALADPEGITALMSLRMRF
jgi:iron complex outermembrane recepter protein